MWDRDIQFKFIEWLGEGGQGRVFKALRIDPASNMQDTVAIKILHSKNAVDLWRQEFESLRAVRSPYCVQVLAFERINGNPALILEYVDGISLMQLAQHIFLEDDDVKELVTQIEGALQDLSRYGIFHGDLSPHNVLVDRNGQIRLLDFGLANDSGPNLRLTPEFAAPERLAGQNANLASDLYSLGKIEKFLNPSAPNSPWLDQDPSRRRLQCETPNLERQKNLAVKINRWLDRQNLLKAFKTKTQHFTRKPWLQISLRAVSCALAIMFLTHSSGMVAATSDPMATLSIRTLRWYQIQINGTDMGYTPLTLQVQANKPLILRWKSTNSRGSRTVVLSPREVIIFNDRDFSH